MGNRMSILDTTLYCGLSGKLSEEHGAGRAAAQSTAFHAKLANVDGWQELVAQLTEKERAEMDTWNAPSTWEPHDGVSLEYAHARLEVEIYLHSNMSGSTTGKPSQNIISTGHPDMFWAPNGWGTQRIYVGDCKRTRFTSHVESLQLHAYGWALADMFGADEYCTGIWVFDENQWITGPVVDVYSEDGAAIAHKVETAIRNSNATPVMGPHCQDCYGRMHCPEYLLPGAALLRSKPDAISALTEPGGITRENQLEVLQAYQGAKVIVEMMKSAIEASVVALGPIADGEGKEYRQVMAKRGRVSFDAKTFEKDNPELYKQYARTGAPHSMGYRWCKEDK